MQVRWGQLLVSKILKKFGKKLELTIEWQPLYKLVHDAHFKRCVTHFFCFDLSMINCIRFSQPASAVLSVKGYILSIWEPWLFCFVYKCAEELLFHPR
jgi:hypothetical protein